MEILQFRNCKVENGSNIRAQEYGVPRGIQSSLNNKVACKWPYSLLFIAMQEASCPPKWGHPERRRLRNLVSVFCMESMGCYWNKVHCACISSSSDPCGWIH